MTSILILLLMLLLGVSCNHFDCEDICQVHRRVKMKKPDNTSRTTPGKEVMVEAGKVNCYGKICVVTTHDYNKFEVPQPWAVPVTGTGHQVKNHVCKKDTSYVLEVGTVFNINAVRGIDVKHGLIEVDMYLEMTWSDPELGICVCDGEEKSSAGIYKVGSNLEDDIWVPDLAVWHYKEFKRVSGLVKLNELELKVLDECSAVLRYAFDFQVKLRCQMVMDWYPYDQNICHVKLGSYSHSSEDLVFAQGEKTSEHTFTKTSYKDYKFKVLPLCAHAMEETMVDVGGETSVYKVSGFSLVITRKSNKVLSEYITVLSLLVTTAIFSSCLPLFSGRAGLVAGTALSTIFVLVLISDYTPHGSGGMNLVLHYSLACLFFIFITYLEYCLLMAILRWPSILPSKVMRKLLPCRVSCKTPCSSPCKKTLEMADKFFFMFWFLAFVVFSVVFWQHHPSFPPPTQCHNEKYAQVDCSNPDQ